MVPRLWLLSQNVLCRVFEGLTYPQIIEQILKDYKIDYEFDLKADGKPVRELCIQYNESDFNFINRLMEEEGVYYFFMHDDSNHKLVITDRSETFESVFQEPLEYIGPNETGVRASGIYEITVRSQVVPSEAAVDDYNFKTPQNDLLARAQNMNVGGTIFHYPGNYWDFSQKDGEYIARIRLERDQKDAVILSGKSNLPFLSQGYYFSLKDHPRGDLNGTPWVFEKVSHFAELEENLTELSSRTFGKKRSIIYQNTFAAFHKKINYRPLFQTPRPKISTQTAVVIGKQDEEIWTDEYGRIHVQFHWENDRKYEEKTSCWVRVASLWTGDQWGIRFTPRIGQEVVVQFLESNPDHPLITGCVYNQDNMPPYLPDSPTVSTIKTNSSPGGEGYNEIRFEDKKEEEQLFIHAQRDMDTLVEANQTITLVEGNRSLTLQAGDESISLEAGNRTTTVKGGDELHQNEQNYTHEVSQNDIKKVGGDLNEEVGGNYSQKIDGNYTQEISGNAEVKVTGNYTLEVQGNLDIKVLGTLNVSATGGCSVMSSANLDMSAGASFSITGTAGVTVSSNAMLSLTGNASAQLTGSGMCQITGGVVMINS
jgi:type VI secretion system secreted protein VgrG